MERTAGGFGSLIKMKFHPQPAATRPPASRRSSCSRQMLRRPSVMPCSLISRMVVLIALLVLVLSARAGEDPAASKSLAGPPSTQPLYRDTEWNLSLWETYTFTGRSYRADEYIQADHGWGGGLTATYFSHRYFGLGIEASVFSARRTERTFESRFLPIAEARQGGNERTLATVVPRFTLRLPVADSGFAPYLFAGAGAIFGGGETSRVVTTVIQLPPPFGDFAVITHVKNHGPHVRAVGELGGGFEFRVTRRVGRRQVVDRFA